MGFEQDFSGSISYNLTGEVVRMTRPISDTIADLSRYDLVLLVIPAAFAAALFLQTVGVIPARTAVLGASAVGVVSMLDALFVNPPKDRPSG